MDVIKTELPGVLLISPKIYRDGRGYFYEPFHDERYASLNLPRFVQDNQSYSLKHVIRGMHYQINCPQGKLLQVIQGRIFDVVADVCPDSPNYGKWISFILDSDTHQQVYVPPGYAHGFCVLSEAANCMYKCTDFYSPEDERGICWDDETLNITWPTKHPLLSQKDAVLAHLASINRADLPALTDFEKNLR